VRQQRGRELGRSEVGVELPPKLRKDVQPKGVKIVQQKTHGPPNGKAPVPDKIPRLFEGEAAFVMATGPGLGVDTVDYIYSLDGYRYIGISDCYRCCPYLDLFYACDHRWWNIHRDNVAKWGSSRGGYWCTEKKTKEVYRDLNWIPGKSGQGWSKDQGLIHYGSNSGYQILNIAYLTGVTTMILVGFNMMVVGDQRHFFGNHPKGLSQNSSYQSFARQFQTIKVPPGVDVINASSPTRLDAFPKMTLRDAVAFAEKKHRGQG
jgi:hypothetical protein